MSLKTEINEAVKGIIKTYDRSKFNVALGFFQEYATVSQDTSGKRYCNVKLHYKTDDNEDINMLEVPLFYPGSKNMAIDYLLESGDELMVFFSDRSISQFHPVNATQPQFLNNKVKDSVNYAFCFPINTHHNMSFLLPADSTVAHRTTVKTGKKVQIGNGTDELLKVLYDFINVFKTVLDAAPADGDSLNTALAGQLSAISALFAKMGNITKI